MSYMALYRKFRPGEFEDVKGQDAIVKTLKNQISAGRIPGVSPSDLAQLSIVLLKLK